MGVVPELTLVEWLRLSQYSLPGPNRTYSQGDTAPGWGCLVKPPLNTKSMSESSPHRKPPPILTSKQNYYCGSHLLSHTHQDAVPSTPQGLAHQVRKGYWAFPPSYHHRKTTKQQPTPQKRGPACCFKTIQRTQTPPTTLV